MLRLKLGQELFLGIIASGTQLCSEALVPLPRTGEQSPQPQVHHTTNTLKFAFRGNSATFAISTYISARNLVCLNI